MRDLVHIITAGETLSVDVTATNGVGQISADEGNAPDAIIAVRQAIQQGDHLIDYHGHTLLVERDAPLAYRFLQVDKFNNEIR